jgi:hypothetical protein
MTTNTNGNQKSAETKAQVKSAGKTEDKPTITPEADIPKPQTMANITKEIDALWQAISQQNKLIVEFQETLARKRRPPASNGKVKVKDKKTGKVYPSKNNAYQTLLRAGELKGLVDKGVFGDVPEKNNFGWYALKRELPDRFEEIIDKESDGKAKTSTTTVPNAK